jgi:transposase InsO family protein
MYAVRDAAYTVDADAPMAGIRHLTQEGLYGRRKMTALIQRSMPDASSGSMDRAMKALGVNRIRCAEGIRKAIPGKDGKPAGDLLDRDFAAAAPNCTWVMDFTYCLTWVGFVNVSFIVDLFAQKIVAWHAATSKDVELVMTPLRMAT